MRILRILILVFLIGLLIFYKSALFGTRTWDWMYYFWDKGCNVLAFWTIYLLVKDGYRKIVAPVLVFSIIRFTWEVASYFTKITVNNSQAVAALFIILVCVILYLFIKELL